MHRALPILLLAFACKEKDPAPCTMNAWFTDADEDGYGAGEPTIACANPGGAVTDGADCNDDDGRIHPGVTEVCDGVDQDCDGVADDGVLTDWFYDGDGDGQGAGPAFSACAAPESYVAGGDDCDDTTALRAPGREEVCDDLDNDCDPSTQDPVVLRCWADADGDGRGDPASPHPRCVNYCDGTDVPNDADCDDDYNRSYPGAPERCDGLDNDCDPSTDPDEGADCDADIGPVWSAAQGAVYYVVEQSQDYEDAVYTCTRNGYHVWWIDSDAERDEVIALAVGVTVDTLWTDLLWNACGPGTGWQHVTELETPLCTPVTPWMGVLLNGQLGYGNVTFQDDELLSAQSPYDEHAVICEANP